MAELLSMVLVTIGVCLVVVVASMLVVVARMVVKLVTAVVLIVMLVVSAEVRTMASLMLGPVGGVLVVPVVRLMVLSLVVNISEAASMVVKFVTVVVFVVVSDDGTVVSVELAPCILMEVLEGTAGVEAEVMLMRVVVVVVVVVEVPFEVALGLVAVVVTN